MDADYVWVLDALQTIAGPKVAGRVHAIASQHTDATDQFVKSVELFVLRPIHDAGLQQSSGAKYFLVALSPRVDGTYCLSVKPSEVGLNLDSSEVKIDEQGYFCFRAAVLASNKRWNGP